MMALSITTLLMKGIAGIVSPARTEGAFPLTRQEEVRMRYRRIQRNKRKAVPSEQDKADLALKSRWTRPGN